MQVFGPVHPIPPHWAHRAAPVPVVGGFVLNDLITFNKTGCMREAIIASPAAFGWTLSLKSETGKPVLQSAIAMGDWAVLRLAAHDGITATNS